MEVKSQQSDKVVAQGIASYAKYLEALRLEEIWGALNMILSTETDALAELGLREARTLEHLGKADNEIANIMASNRGGDKGAHGFIAEFAEEGIVNCRRAYDGIRRSVTTINDNGPVDLHIGQHDTQMKFSGNLENELRQAELYRSMKMMYPKDHMEVFRRVAAGERDIFFQGKYLTLTKVLRIQRIIEQESVRRGQSFNQWAESSSLEYSEVQKGAISDTLSSERESIIAKSNDEKHDIANKADSDRVDARKISEPSFGEASKVAGIGAAVQGAAGFGVYVYRKHKEGKEIWEFGVEEWKESGAVTAKGAVKGAISGYAIYRITNVCKMNAPSAGALTAGTFGLVNALVQYRSECIDDDDFIDLVLFNAIDATGAAVGAAIGQMVIPIPVIGAVVGSILSTQALKLGKGLLSKQEIKVISEYQKKLDNFLSKQDADFRDAHFAIIAKYQELGDLQDYSFNLETNIKLQIIGSVKLAQKVGVPDSEILHNIDETDAYFIQ